MDSSSSDDSLIWTNASSDSSDSSDTNMIPQTNMHDSQHEEESESGKNYKKKLQQQLFCDTPQELKTYKHKIKDEKITSIQSDKKIKLEPDSDIEIKKKTKKHLKYDTTGETHDSHDSISQEESYLNLRVKEENSSFSTPNLTKQKKKKNRDSTEYVSEEMDSNVGKDYTKSEKVKKRKSNNREDISDTNNVDTEQDINDVDLLRRKKKKAKHKHNLNEQNESSFNEIEMEKFSADETIVETPLKKKKKSKKDKNISIRLSNSNIEDKSDINNISAVSDDVSKVQSDKLNNINTTTQKRKSVSISERIQFEDEDTFDNIDLVYKNKNPNIKYGQFLKLNSNLTPFAPKLQKNAIITSNDELWVVKCPNEFDIREFKDYDIALGGKCKIKLNGQTYEGKTIEETNYIAIVTQHDKKNTIANFETLGLINFHRKIPKAHIIENNNMSNNQTNFIPLPETKCRHPLFGATYKHAIKLPTSISERLNTTTDTLDFFEKTKKKKKKKNHKNEKSFDEPDASITLDVVPELKQSKKRKRSLVEENTSKTKRVKYNLDSVEAWESEKTIEENLFNI